MNATRKTFLSIAIVGMSALTLSACTTGEEEGGAIKTEAKYPTGMARGANENDIYSKPASIFGEGGLSFGGKRKDNNEDGASGIAVNSFLWRASLDTVSFMPLASADRSLPSSLKRSAINPRPKHAGQSPYWRHWLRACRRFY